MSILETLFHGDGFKDVYQLGPVLVVYVIILSQLHTIQALVLHYHYSLSILLL